MHREAVVSAQQEAMYLSVDLDTRRVAPWPVSTHAGLREAVSAHGALPVPDWVGRRIAMPRRA
jgi:acyl-CoA thioester hydrolase